MFDSVDFLVDECDRRRTIATEMTDDDDETLESAYMSLNNWITFADRFYSQSRTFRGYELLVQNIPRIEDKLLSMEVDELVVYFRDVSNLVYCLSSILFWSPSKLRKGASGARGDDAANLKPAIVSWVLALFVQPVVLLSPTSKADRGFEHYITGRLLCPIEYAWTDETCVIHKLMPARLITWSSSSVVFKETFGKVTPISASLPTPGRLFSTLMRLVMWPTLKITCLRALF